LEENVNPGLPAEQAERLLATLPDAELAGYMENAHVRRPVVAPRTGDEHKKPIVPTYRPLAGMGELNRGNVGILTPVLADGAVFASPGVVTSVVETPKGIGDDAEVLNVTLGVARVSPDNVKANQYISCILEWGIGGATFSTEFDWVNGLSFSLSASFIRVKGRVVNYGPDASYLSGQVMLSASLSYGFSGQRTSAIRKTVVTSPDVLGNGLSSDLVEIPSFATAFTVVAGIWGLNPAPATPVRIRQFSRDNAGAGEECVATFNMEDLGNASFQKEDCFPIMNGARFLQLTNFTGGNIGAAIGGQNAWQGARVVFGLSL
jgi:hypothetical protein